MEDFKSTYIWKKTLGQARRAPNGDQIEELRTSYLKFRENTAHLVSRISATLPSLTQHEITHLDSLWDTASLIVGDGYPLNPLEGFILGGSILVHDSALCFEAYENGQIGLRQTYQWKDAFTELNSQSDSLNTQELEKQADFIALRELHATEAESMLERSWKDPYSGENLYLLENPILRKHLGKLIGKIAASHHWDIDQLCDKLSTQQNALPGFPREWRIDAVKIACILRCADAAHFDNLRAPDFLLALIKRNGVSLDHWQAQNRISRVDIDQNDPKRETLLFTSSIAFNEEDASSWYIAYDAICLVEKEIRACNSLLSKRDKKLEFKVRKVRGIESPLEFSKFIKVDNWKPCSAVVHVGNVEKLIVSLGGEMLYGPTSDLLGIALRELIQNSRDAIMARSTLENIYEGKINTKIEFDEDRIFFTIEDNGVGMSEKVLTGPLLDFGTSFWTSALVKSEFPGLRSSIFKSIGKFGIGFYSIFMIAKSVIVESRHWKDGLSEVYQLKFSQGFTLRPILKRGFIPDFPSNVSTRIKVEIKNALISKELMIEIKNNLMGSSHFKVPFSSYLSALVAGLDVDVYLDVNGNGQQKIHTNPSSREFSATEWLERISFTKSRLSSNNLDYIKSNANRLRPIFDKGKQIGLAAISTKFDHEQDFLSISTVGGLANSVHNRDSNFFIGYLDYKAKSAKREIGEFSGSIESIQDWANNQLKELLKVNLSPTEKCIAASSLCHFKIDPTEIACVLVSINKKYTYATIEELAEFSLQAGIVFLKSSSSSYMELHHNINEIPNYALVIATGRGAFMSLDLDDNIMPQKNFSLLDCLYRKIISKGYLAKIDEVKNIGENIFGYKINALIITSRKNDKS
jgi:hypothetical protein